ncbi:FdrA family protein [Aeromicrobium sp. CF3.5]|uniref:FdrA family protein n=1 Tax=Aeromicrobium sp. CF3.5 TaxID=3373078 RepID=UPI003EE6F024
MTSPTDATSVDHVEIRSGAYADSVALLQVSKDVASAAGVQMAQVAMATPLNLGLLEEMGFDLPDVTVNDMIVALRLESTAHRDTALQAVEAALAATTHRESGQRSSETIAPRTTISAMTRFDTSLAVVSVPGAHAAVEAMDALDRGQDVMIFSDNVPVDQEVALKTIARERGLLVMGPDCGTAVVGGVGLGFANTVRPGTVGMVAASGTGCQQLLSLLDHAEVGVSAALGVGGRDLSTEVGGMAAMQALTRLDQDPGTELIVVVSKPPAEDVATELRAFADALSTPVEFALLGAGQPDLTAAAETVLAALGRPIPVWPTWGSPAAAAAPGHLRGLFVGGTLCDESMLIAASSLGPIRSNIPLDPALALDSTLSADAHLMIDFGDDSLTAGRAHPMIDPSIRLEHLTRFAADPQTSVILMDVVLGHGSESDPSAALAPGIRQAIESARDAGRELAVVMACVGTAADPQHLSVQASALADAGAEVFLSNAQAARRAVSLIGDAR